RQFLVNIGSVFAIMALLAFLVDSIELLRRASDDSNVGLGLLSQLALLRLPMLTQKLLPFAALFGAIWSFSRLTRTHELIVARAVGVSVWQFLTPALVLAMVIGIFVVTVFNPLGATMISRFERLEAVY